MILSIIHWKPKPSRVYSPRGQPDSMTMELSQILRDTKHERKRWKPLLPAFGRGFDVPRCRQRSLWPAPKIIKEVELAERVMPIVITTPDILRYRRTNGPRLNVWAQFRAQSELSKTSTLHKMNTHCHGYLKPNRPYSCKFTLCMKVWLAWESVQNTNDLYLIASWLEPYLSRI